MHLAVEPTRASRVVGQPALDFPLNRGAERVLLINPAVYDTRFAWAKWTQPTGLLRLATYFRAKGVDVKLVDAVWCPPGERLRRKQAEILDLDGLKVNRWRFGSTRPSLRGELRALAKERWLPDQVYVEGLTTFWWQGAAEAIEIAKEVFPTSQAVLLGAYPELAPQHAIENTSADDVLSALPTPLLSLGADLSVYKIPPSFTYAWINGGGRTPRDVVDEIVAKAGRRAVRHLAFADSTLAGDEESADRFRDVLEGISQASLPLRLYAVGNISPGDLVAHPDLPQLMKRSGYSQIHFADDRSVPDDDGSCGKLVEQYRQAAELLHAAGFGVRKAELSGAVSIGRRDECLGRRASLATQVAHAIGSLILWPYQPSIEECGNLPLEDQNGKLFPLRGKSGPTYQDYMALTGLAAMLNSKYRERTFDFLGKGLIPSFFRQSIRDRAWEPPDEIKGSLRVERPSSASQPAASATPAFTLVRSPSRRRAEVVLGDRLPIPTGPAGFRRALLLNPPVYDAQYWARWSQPAGLLRLASHLGECGYLLDLVDCMETNPRGYVPKARRIVDGRPDIIQRDDVSKPIYHFGSPWNDVEQRLKQMDPPDEVWITSIMTYWWESTRDAVALVRRVFPGATILVGGIYPTLAPEHAAENLEADVVVVGEIAAASHVHTDLGLYRQAPSYAILTTSRGCPWECHYCSARTLNGGSNKMRAREPEEVLEEIEFKYKTFGIRRFGFYEDNALALRGHLQQVLELIIERGLKLQLYAPEGFETRLLTVDLLRTMKQAGFEKVHLPFEALRWETNLGWNRRHASTASFERALDAAIQAGFRPRTEEINAFVLFGLPDDALEHILDGVLYVHHMVGSNIPMLFTPVPGTQIFREHEHYLLHEEREGRRWDLQDLNGKLLPFLEYNRRRYPGLRASDYLQLEGLMSILNSGKVLWRNADLCDGTTASEAFRGEVGKLFERVEQRMHTA